MLMMLVLFGLKFFVLMWGNEGWMLVLMMLVYMVFL